MIEHRAPADDLGTRRDFLSRSARLAAATAGGVALTQVLAACGSDDESGSAAAASTVTAEQVAAAKGSIAVAGWEFYRYDAGQNAGPVKAEWTFVTAVPDIVTKSRQPGIDVVSGGGQTMAQLLAAESIQPIDVSLLTNYDAIPANVRDDPAWKGPDGAVFAVPFAAFDAVIATDRRNAPAPRSPQELLRPEYKGKLGLLDQPDTVQIIAHALGVPDFQRLARPDFERVQQYMEQLKPQIRTFFGFGEEADLLAGGDIAVVITSGGTVLAGATKGGSKIAIADFGSVTLVDAWCVTRDADVARALSWIDRALTAEAQRGQTEASGSFPVNAAAESAVPAADRMPLEQRVEQAPVLFSAPVEAGDVVTIQELTQYWNDYKTGVAA